MGHRFGSPTLHSSKEKKEETLENRPIWAAKKATNPTKNKIGRFGGLFCPILPRLRGEFSFFFPPRGRKKEEKGVCRSLISSLPILPKILYIP